MPRDITKTGKLADDIWLVGTVVRLREIKRNTTEDSNGKTKGKSSGRGKASTKQAKCKPQDNEALEFHLNGGRTPADVLVLQAWGATACRSVKPFFKKGEMIMISKVYIKEHTEKTASWVSSRHEFFGVIEASSEIKRYECEANWIQYHPITPLLSLRHLPHNTFVCLAGMVLSPGPVKKFEKVDGEEATAITNFQIRAQDGIVQVEAWREAADYAAGIKAGRIYYFEGIKKIIPDKNKPSLSSVRYQKDTTHDRCERALEDAIKLATENNAAGAVVISPTAPVHAKKEAASYKVEDSDWVSLSVLAAIISGDESRRLEGALQVPSVLLKPVGDKITYLACASCHKAVYDTKSCQCATTETKIRFRTDVRLEDDTYQVKAVIFDAMEALVKFAADGEGDKEKAEYYHENVANVEELSMAIEAMPCTVLVALEENSYKGNIEVNLKAVEQTFHVDKSKIRHPLKPVLRHVQNRQRTSVCPACPVADTQFEEGAGVTLVPGGTTQKFRALLTVLDKQATTERVDEASPAVRCARKVCCALQEEGETTTYTLCSVGPINFATRLHTPRKGETLHAIVSRRSTQELTLLAFTIEGESTGDAASAFKAFFAKEAQLNKAFHEEPTNSSVQFDDAVTPVRKHKKAIGAARKLTTPEPWSKRNRCD